MIPIKSIAIVIVSLTWLGISIKQWGFDYPDLSSLLFSIGFFFVGLYVAYDQWFKRNWEKNNNNLLKDIQAIDSKASRLENKIIEIRN